MQFHRTELKTRRQKPGESLQELAADVERLMSLAYAECPHDRPRQPSSPVHRRCHSRRRNATLNKFNGLKGFEIDLGI
ncbi:hypothetical protein AVEN_118222-1 [Araneus ventricosus]|uniref:Uncharacterized protein n=1 Tax=Araneus ventricosus TaxID=182803 RepID=A0A4Y1ZVJ2_ARAVE|nr:hypothetical protein AVEN_2301-1 [Araneus ventricosus]GBL70391.1 hypothetical protein AVEN_118222-1 [Araneus ventricosus]